MRSRTPLVLMEQLVMVLVFALSAAFCLRIFVLSDRISRENEATTHAALLAQNTAELLKGRGSSWEQVLEAQGWKNTADGWQMEYNKAWEPFTAASVARCGMEEEPWRRVPRYRIEVREEETEIHGLCKVSIQVFDVQEAVRQPDGLSDSSRYGQWDQAGSLIQIPAAWQEVQSYE